MIFWILVAILSIAVVAAFVMALSDYREQKRVFGPYADGASWIVGAPIVTALIGSGVGLVIIGFVYAFATMFNAPYSYEEDYSKRYTHDLRALNVGDGIEGRSYFLGSGYLNGERVFNYITRANDGAFTLHSSDADVSKVYEDTADPRVDYYYWNGYLGWLVPWPSSTTELYEFHVQQGSVLEGSIEVSNE